MKETFKTLQFMGVVVLKAFLMHRIFSFSVLTLDCTTIALWHLKEAISMKSCVFLTEKVILLQDNNNPCTACVTVQLQEQFCLNCLVRLIQPLLCA